MIKNNHEYYEQLDALRGFAAMLVLGFHFIIVSGAQQGWLAVNLPIFHIGWIGVDLFLLISGFVITRSALLSNNLQNKEDRQRYVLRRWSRIIPLYLITCVVWLIFIDASALQHSAKHTIFQIATHLFFIHDFFIETATAINGPTWSIALEVQFYVAVYFLIYKLKPKRPALMLLSCVSLAWFCRYLVTVLIPYDAANEGAMNLYAGLLPSAMDRFGFGIFLAILVVKFPNSFVFKKSWFNFLTPLFLTLILLKIAYKLLENFPYWSTSGMVIFWRTLLAISFTFLILSFINMPKLVKNIMRPFNYIGKISYGIYLWHMAILTLLVKYTDIRNSSLLFILIILSILGAACSWHFFEKPVMQYFQRK